MYYKFKCNICHTTKLVPRIVLNIPKNANNIVENKISVFCNVISADFTEFLMPKTRTLAIN